MPFNCLVAGALEFACCYEPILLVHCFEIPQPDVYALPRVHLTLTFD
jgi:hypothetical protein